MNLQWIIFALHLGLVCSVPSCKFTGTHGSIATCKAGNTDYLLRRGLVSDNNRTTVVVLKSCRIADVELESFANLPRAHTIDISLNKLQTFKLGALDDLNRIKIFNISHNIITEIPLGLFDKMINLEVLDAKGNKFKNFELGIFDPMTKLLHLDISRNELNGEKISPYLLDQTTKLMLLDYSNNDMSKTPDNLLNSLQVLEFLDLDNCLLVDVPQFALASNLGSLRHLMVSNNHIATITNSDTFKYLVGLQIMDLSGNKIISLDEDIFKHLTILTTLKLSYNLIQILPANLFRNLSRLKNLDLSHNRLHSIHESAFHSLPRLKRLNISLNRLTFLPESFCRNMADSGTNLGKFYFNDNPWQCACLKDVLQEVKKYKLVYNGNKYKGMQAVCAEPEGWNFSCKRSSAVIQEVYQLFDAKYSAILGI